MRADLKHPPAPVYGLCESDFDYVLRLAKKVVESHRSLSRSQTEGLLGDSTGGEIASDIRHYAYIETVFLWEYALWRLQGVLEGLITTVFLPPMGEKPLLGLEAKLKAMETAGFTIEPEDRRELLAWAGLRNAISHEPPERYRPIGLQEQDIQEYADLLRMQCKRWRVEAATMRKAGA